MNKSINSRIKEVRTRFCGGSNTEFAKLMKKGENTVSNWVREGYSVGRGVAGEIADTFGVDKNWLLTGEGEMIKETTTHNYNHDTNSPTDPFREVDITNIIKEEVMEKTAFEKLVDLIANKDRQIDQLLNQQDKLITQQDRLITLAEIGKEKTSPKSGADEQSPTQKKEAM